MAKSWASVIEVSLHRIVDTRPLASSSSRPTMQSKVFATPRFSPKGLGVYEVIR
jgi:hypothetical protein